MIKRLLLSIIALVFLQPVVHCADDRPSKDVPELEVLSNYIGKWDVAITSKDSPFTKGDSTAQWILNGRFVQQTGSLASSDVATAMKVTTLVTYDKKERAYRMWTFLSDGTSIEASGKWDAKSHTMTSVSQRDGMTITTTASFAKKGTEEWTIITKNKKGEMVGNFSGTNTLAKE